MSINNIARHHTNRLSGQNSLASACLARLAIDRDLEVGPGYCIRRKKRTYHSFDYRDIIGNPCKRKELANLYSVAEKTVSLAYERNDGNFLLANIELIGKLRIKK